MAADALYGNELENSESVDNYRRWPSSKLFLELSTSRYEHATTRRSPLLDIAVGLGNTVSPEESITRRQGDMISAFIARGIEIRSPTPEDVRSAEEWFDQLPEKQRASMLRRSGGDRDTAVRMYLKEEVLKPRASQAVSRGVEVLDLFTREAVAPGRRTMDISRERRTDTAILLTGAQEVGSMYALRSSLQDAGKPLQINYQTQQGQEEVLDLSKLPSPIPVTFKLPYEREQVLATIGDTLKEYWRYRMYLLRTEFDVTADVTKSPETAADRVRPRLLKHLAPSIAYAEAKLTEETGKITWTEKSRSVVFTQLQSFVDEQVSDVMKQMQNPQMANASIVLNLETAAQAIRQRSAKSLYEAGQKKEAPRKAA